MHRKEDIEFVMRISKHFDTEILKPRSTRLRQDLMYLGRWQFIKDWIDLRVGTSKEINELAARLVDEVLISKRSPKCS
jgi:hypothetical protein